MDNINEFKKDQFELMIDLSQDKNLTDKYNFDDIYFNQKIGFYNKKAFEYIFECLPSFIIYIIKFLIYSVSFLTGFLHSVLAESSLLFFVIITWFVLSQILLIKDLAYLNILKKGRKL